MLWHACAGSSSDEDEEGEEGGFEKIKSRTEKKKDKLLTMDPNDVTYEMVAKKLKEVVGLRGKKGIDRQEQVQRMPWSYFFFVLWRGGHPFRFG
jgi:translation initiation factor 3 subunit C